jgi:hypothetical protein
LGTPSEPPKNTEVNVLLSGSLVAEAAEWFRECWEWIDNEVGPEDIEQARQNRRSSPEGGVNGENCESESDGLVWPLSANYEREDAAPDTTLDTDGVAENLIQGFIRMAEGIIAERGWLEDITTETGYRACENQECYKNYNEYADSKRKLKQNFGRRPHGELSLLYHDGGSLTYSENGRKKMSQVRRGRQNIFTTGNWCFRKPDNFPYRRP